MGLRVAFIALVCLVSLELNGVNGHGRMVSPPSRSSAWRYGFKTVPNYSDHELYCGGVSVQHKQNGGRCGICGDPFNGVRDNELPNGKYAKGLVVTRTYKEGESIQVQIQLTANHMGAFVFKLCPATSKSQEVSQDCLDRYQLKVTNSRDSSKYILVQQGPGMFNVGLKLPAGVTCERCVLQWTYRGANSWGECGNGKGAVGCGPQETFRNCADIKITGRRLYDDQELKAANYEDEIENELDQIENELELD